MGPIGRPHSQPATMIASTSASALLHQGSSMASFSSKRFLSGVAVARRGTPRSVLLSPAQAARRVTGQQQTRRSYASEASGGSNSEAAVSFILSEDQQAIQDLTRQFTKEQIVPVAAQYDRSMEYPMPVIKKAWEAGLVNTHIPEAYGGPGLDMLSCSLISEELAFGCSGIQTAIEANGLAEAPLIVAGSEATKQKYLGRMSEEPLIAAYCVTEPSAGSPTEAKQTRSTLSSQRPTSRQRQTRA